MNYSNFVNHIKTTLYGLPIQKEYRLGENIIGLSEDLCIFVNYKKTDFKSIEEAKNSILEHELNEKLKIALYRNIPNENIINIIKEYHDIRITNTLIESYLNMAIDKVFMIDEAVIELRNFAGAAKPINKIDFVLNDGSTVAINENTFEMLRVYLNDKYKLIDFMRESSENFKHIVSLVKEL
jgi:hypothetical protein